MDVSSRCGAPSSCHALTRRLIAAALAAGALVTASVVPSTETLADPTVPWVEAWAPGAFDLGGRTPLRELSAAYRVDATVLLPLLFTSVPIVSRSGVGIARATARDFEETQDARLRAYEFFAASLPERARGLNRLGFLREAVRLTATGADWTTHFGVIAANREDTRNAAEQALDDAENEDSQPYSIINGRIGADRARNSVVHLTLPSRWTSAAQLYTDLRPRWQGREPDYTRDLRNEGDHAYGQPFGFLGSLQVSLRSVAAAVERGEDPRRRHRYQPYVHNGHVFRFELRDVDDDEEHARRYAQEGWVTDPTAVRRLEYTIRDERNKNVETFTLWVELPRAGFNDPFAAPIVPLAFEFTPRAFLVLKAVRTQRVMPADLTDWTPAPATTDQRLPVTS